MSMEIIPGGVKLSGYWNKKLTSLIQALMKNIRLWAYIRTKILLCENENLFYTL